MRVLRRLGGGDSAERSDEQRRYGHTAEQELADAHWISFVERTDELVFVLCSLVLEPAASVPEPPRVSRTGRNTSFVGTRRVQAAKRPLYKR
jgi:hypothetical protein